MTQEFYLKQLTVPQGKVDVVQDTDAYNEIDDQFAICYLIKSTYKFCVKGICAAPFLNKKVVSAAEGMNSMYETNKASAQAKLDTINQNYAKVFDEWEKLK